jgi:arylsulfatase A-like enzyme
MPYYEDNDPEIKYWEGYSPFAVCNDAQEYIAERKDDEQPFFLLVSIATPHFPHHTAPQEFKDLYPEEDIILNPNVPEELHQQARTELQGYYAHCTATDQAVGELLDRVKELGLWDKTIIYFTSDHGEIMGAHGARIKQKQVPWIESAGVPLIISDPSGMSKMKLEMSVTTPDISATLLELAGIDIPEIFEGKSFADAVLNGKDDTGKASLYMLVSPFAAVREEYKREYRAVKTSEYTYVKVIDGPWMLFDDKKDPFQQNNLVGDPDFAGLQENMEKLLEEELQRINDDFRPAESYITEWGYTIRPAGHIPYGDHDQVVQSPKK